ncbi:hypothetical protein LTR86_005423 [Recurvomyces mirabilis]|nr:hypothetical protein LTR86_005423 [Recurvomyces mirabilis]
MFSRSFFLALLSAPLLVLADGPNAFNNANGTLVATAGQPLTLNWTPSTSGSISLVLRSGSSNDLAAGTVIASNVPNSGSYTWTPDTMLTRGSDYTVEIVDDTDPTQVNYTPYFVLDSSNTVAYSTSEVSLGTASASAILSTLSSASATGSATSVAAAISSSKASASASGSSTGSAASMTGSSSMKASGSATSAASSGASAASSSVAIQTQSAAGAAPRATAMAGMLGLAALGALAL